MHVCMLIKKCINAGSNEPSSNAMICVSVAFNTKSQEPVAT